MKTTLIITGIILLIAAVAWFLTGAFIWLRSEYEKGPNPDI